MREEVRIRCSTNVNDRTAGSNDATAAATVTGRVRSNACTTITITGQCHKYHEYDQSPTRTIGLAVSGLREESPTCTPPAIARIAPLTGSHALQSGNGVRSVKAIDAQA